MGPPTLTMDPGTAMVAYEWLLYYYITAVVLAVMIGMVLERRWSIGRTALCWGLLIIVPAIPLYPLIQYTFVGLSEILVWWAFLPILGMLGAVFLYQGDRRYNVQISLYGSIMVMIWCGLFCIAIWQLLYLDGLDWSRLVFILASAVTGIGLLFYVRYRYVSRLKEYVELNEGHNPPYLGQVALIAACTTVCHVAWFYVVGTGEIYFTIITLAVVILLTSITKFVFIGLTGMADKIRSDSELETARRLQQSVLPDTRTMDWKIGFEVAAMMEPAKEVGGDFYDIFRIGDRRVAFVIGDVSDKGIPSAMFMMRSRSTIREKLFASDDVGDAVSAANEALMEDNSTSMFVTSCISVLDLDTGVLSYVNAGHIPPVLVRDGTSTYLRGERGPFLGMRPFRYVTESITLGEGDIITVFTDGVTEAESNGSFYGTDRVLEVLSGCGSPQESIDGLRDGVLEFAEVNDNQDDMAILSFTFTRTIHADMLAVDESIDDAITLIEDACEGLPTELSIRAQMVTEEVLANIVDNSAPDHGTQVSLTLCVDDGLTVVYIDDSTRFNPLKAKIRDRGVPLDDRLNGGEGIRLIRSMSDGQSYRYDRGRNILKLWFVPREGTE